MSGKSKKKGLESLTPQKDKFMNIFAGFGGFLVLLTMIPAIPWRMAAQTPYFGARFMRPRPYSPLSVGDNFGMNIMWTKMRKQVCKADRKFQMPNPAAAAAGALSSILGAGASLTGCATWQICKAHVTQRCIAYTTMMGLGIFVIISQLVSLIACIMTPVFCSWETQEPADAKEKKARKKMSPEEYGKATMVASILSFVFTFLPTVTWYFVSESTFKGLQKTSFYPFPAASVGLYIAVAANFFLFVNMYCGITRIHPLFKKKEEKVAEEPEQYGEPAAAGAFGAPPGFGAPPMGMPAVPPMS